MEDIVLLDDNLENSSLKLVDASKGKRLANYLIDLIATMILGFVLGFGLYALGIIGDDVIAFMDDPLGSRATGALLIILYYAVFEGLVKGKTIGKMITKTRAVNLDGTQPEFGTIMKRTISRIVPFEVFSFLGSRPTGWHDRWSDTIVIDEKQSSL